MSKRLQREPLGGTGKKLEVVRSAALHAYPVADIDTMSGEMARGYAGQSQR